MMGYCDSQMMNTNIKDFIIETYRHMVSGDHVLVSMTPLGSLLPEEYTTSQSLVSSIDLSVFHEKRNQYYLF